MSTLSSSALQGELSTAITDINNTIVANGIGAITAPILAADLINVALVVRDIISSCVNIIDSYNAPQNVISSSYAVGSQVGDVLVNFAGPVEILLPAASGRQSPISVVDISGNATTHNITVTALGSDKIIGASTFVITQDWQSITLYPYVSGWYLKVFKGT